MTYFYRLSTLQTYLKEKLAHSVYFLHFIIHFTLFALFLLFIHDTTHLLQFSHMIALRVVGTKPSHVLIIGCSLTIGIRMEFDC